MEIITGLVAAPLQSPAASVTAPPDAAATQRFAALMQPSTGVPADVHLGAIPAAGVPAMDSAAAKGPASVGDRILGGMQNMSEEFRGSWTQVADMLRAGSPQLDMQAMLKLQLHLTQASLQYEMVGKAVSRSTQNFDQLVRVQ